MENLFRRVARRLVLGPPAPIPHEAFIADGRLVVGRHTYDMPTIVDYDDGPFTVSIGAFCSIAVGVEIIPGGQHHLDAVSTFPFGRRLGWEYQEPPAARDVTIGNDVWIGRGATVLGGVRIGDGAVVGASAIVTKDVAPYTIVAGAPATVRRLRVRPDVAEALLEIRWWDWPDDRIRDVMRWMHDPDAFVRHARPGR